MIVYVGNSRKLGRHIVFEPEQFGQILILIARDDLHIHDILIRRVLAVQYGTGETCIVLDMDMGFPC